MDEQILQIAERLKGLRDALDLSPEEVAAVCQLTPDGVDLATLMFGDEPRMSTYFVTRRGKGVTVERSKAYRYQSLAAGFVGRRADPFVVTVHPNEDTMSLNTHPGEEFNMVLEGRMLRQIGNKQLTLGEGDSIYFNANQPHGMKALDGKKVIFLAVIL